MAWVIAFAMLYSVLLLKWPVFFLGAGLGSFLTLLAVGLCMAAKEPDFERPEQEI